MAGASDTKYACRVTLSLVRSIGEQQSKHVSCVALEYNVLVEAIWFLEATPGSKVNLAKRCPKQLHIFGITPENIGRLTERNIPVHALSIGAYMP